MTLVCTSLTATTSKQCINEMQSAKAAGADIAEIRLDFLLPGEDWQTIIRDRCLPVVVTNRATWEGGKSADDESIRLGKLAEAEALGAEYVDVELKAVDRYLPLRPSSSASKMILSNHNFDGPYTLEQLGEIYSSMVEKNADVVKVAMMADSILDNLVVFEFMRTATVPVIALAMGERGQISRILAQRYGALLTFTALSAGKESAPGQLSTETIVNLYRFHKITSATKLYGIMANPVGHSMSPLVHNSAFQKMGLDCLFLPLLVDDVAEYLKMSGSLGIRGYSITIPHKEKAVTCVENIDPVAEKIGAINTIVVDELGTKTGYNTDWVAAISAVEDVMGGQESKPLKGKIVTVLGAGGAARALAFGAINRGVSQVIIANRTYERAQNLADELSKKTTDPTISVSSMSMESFNAGNAGVVDVIMNTTAVGMHPYEDASPVSVNRLEAQNGIQPVVFDAVYNPLETVLLREAKAAGCAIVSGLEMFVRQAVRQFELWTGKPAPKDLMEQKVLGRLLSKL